MNQRNRNSKMKKKLPTSRSSSKQITSRQRSYEKVGLEQKDGDCCDDDQVVV